MKKLFAMLLALCLMCGAVSAGAEDAPITVQNVKVGNMTFEIPAEVAVEDHGELTIATATCDNYNLYIYAIDWSIASFDLYATDYDEQINNFIWLNAMFFGDAQMAVDILNASACKRGDVNLLDGQDAVYFGADGLGLLTHYYRDAGFLIVVEGTNKYATGTRAMETAIDIARSFRIDGVTEEQMAADAEAARIAAEQAAMQKYVVITNSSANIRSGPGGDYDKVTTARQGDTFPLIGEDGNWYIIDVNGRTGYVTKGLSKIK